MKQLQEILYKVALKEVHGSTDRQISAICIDSRSVRAGDLFIAMQGTLSDGHQFIGKAVDQGAAAVVCQQLPDVLHEQVTYLKVADSRQAAGIIAANFYDNPSEKLQLVGVTGTNGKTTVTTLLYEVFTYLGYKTGLLSTIRNIIAGKVIPATHTTPDAISLNSLLAQMVEEGCTHAFMEVSSHACDQQRIAGLVFKGAVFTNISHDHLDYHHTLQDYIFAKKNCSTSYPVRPLPW